jgi:carboxymethylenebutenolidase
MDAGPIDYAAGDARVAGYVARPSAAGPHPGLVLIPDVHGLGDHYRDVARRYASEGFCGPCPTAACSGISQPR